MRGLSRQERYRLPGATGPLMMLALGLTAAMANAAEPGHRSTSGSTVEVSVPRSARRPAAAAPAANDYPASRSTAVRSASPPRAAAGPVRQTAAYSSHSANDDHDYAPRSSSGLRYPSTQTAMRTSSTRTRAQMVEEIGPGEYYADGGQGEVIYDNYQPNDMFDGGYQGHGGGYPGGYAGSRYGWNYGAPYAPDVWATKTWGITAGAEALFLRAHFSQGMAMEAISGTQPGQTALVNINGINWDNPYQGAFRTYLGIRDLVCGDELRFSYWNFGTNSNISRVADETTHYCDFLCNMTANPGDVMSTGLNLQLNVFDLDLIKAFCLPQPCMPSCDSCGDCDSCGSCDSCGPCCPVWDVRWFAGLRFAQVNHFLNSSIVTADGVQAVAADSSAKFFGVGPRIGLQMRRYFDHAARFSVYGRGAGSLLVGNLQQEISNFNITPPETLVTVNDRFNRVVPVADIEIGATWCILPRLSVSGGWLASAWWDLGLQERVSDYDTSNILGFDGFFVRAEIVF